MGRSPHDRYYWLLCDPLPPSKLRIWSRINIPSGSSFYGRYFIWSEPVILLSASHNSAGAY